ncbi:MAG TPA: prepilin-type N-terminal cleavage/methylation domain-containing protein [Gemmatimonadaceae bacterium]|nr:prepilin-type N-terminal cleavage/methylation domain-containing protein [Gemmatimonadaceae bacterium]
MSSLKCAKRASRRLRRGFTLIEIMVAIVLLSIVVGGLLAVVMEQERFYDGATEVMDVRDNLRRIGDLIPAEMRGLAPLEGDLITMMDSAVEFRAPTGASIVCTIDLARLTITVPPVALQSDAGLTSWASAPLLSDSMFIFDSMDALPDTFIGRGIVAAPGIGVCPTTTGFTSNVTEAAGAVSFVLNSALPNSVPVGAPIRFFRRVRYSLYQSPTDRLWYMGYRDFVPSRSPAWSQIQAVAGPLMPYASSGATGLRFTYRDSDGTALTSAADAPRVRRIEIDARAQSATVMRTGGLKRSASGHYVDSLRTVVALRNY